MTDINSIKTAGKKDVPSGTRLWLSRSSIPNHVRVKIKLPSQVNFKDLGHTPIVNGVVTLPLKLVFLCHAHEDRVIVREIKDRLWQDGFLVWMDEKNLLPGDKWKSVIDDTIKRADYVLVFLSKKSISKVGYVQREMKYAFECDQMLPMNQRYIIPILLEQCDPPTQFQDIHWLELWHDNAYDKLKEALK